MHEFILIYQNKNMRKSFLLYVIVFIFVVGTFSAILPYPIFSNYTNVTEKNVYEINNYYESEYENNQTHTNKILNLDWSGIDCLIHNDSEFEVIDIETEQTFYVKRIGGTNHADITAVSQNDFETIKNLYTLSWQRHPVLVKLNDYSYLPASLVSYPHGFEDENKIMNGHFCLHFKNSKTHGTNRIDDEHQKCVAIAKKKGVEIIKII